MTEFAGFPRAAVAFLKDLEDNNDRDWFKANRSRYDDHLATPALALAADLKRYGTVRLFRPYNDTRFHAKPPIKEHIGIPFGIEGSVGYYVELSLDGLLIAAGMYRAEPDQVARLREAIADGRKGGALVRALGKAADAGFELGEADLKRVPRGYDADHPRADLLRRKRFVLHRRDKIARWIHTPECGERIAAGFTAVTSTVRWLRDNVGPSQTAPR